MGKHSNILLVDKSSHKILEVIKHVGFSQNSYRTLLPGRPTSLRQVRNLSILLLSRMKSSLKSLQTQETTTKNLQSLFQGLGRDTANELERILVSEKLSAFRNFFNQETKPCLTETSFSPVPFANQVGEPLLSLSDLLDTYYKDKAERDRVKQQASELIRRVENELQKNRHKLKNKKESYWRQTTLKNFVKRRIAGQPSSTKCLTTKTRLS